MPILEDREIVELAESFADAIPEGEISVCSVSYLSPVSVPMHGLLFRLLAWKDICSRIRRAPENASRRSLNGAARFSCRLVRR